MIKKTLSLFFLFVGVLALSSEQKLEHKTDEKKATTKKVLKPINTKVMTEVLKTPQVVSDVKTEVLKGFYVEYKKK